MVKVAVFVKARRGPDRRTTGIARRATRIIPTPLPPQARGFARAVNGPLKISVAFYRTSNHAERASHARQSRDSQPRGDPRRDGAGAGGKAHLHHRPRPTIAARTNSDRRSRTARSTATTSRARCRPPAAPDVAVPPATSSSRSSAGGSVNSPHSRTASSPNARPESADKVPSRTSRTHSSHQASAAAWPCSRYIRRRLGRSPPASFPSSRFHNSGTSTLIAES